ncbi:hypothetical protein Patl1_36966 [Pistacia atlantica]|nr:hypothetical protein Patl1_36966 [Pistacia atlantica]
MDTFEEDRKMSLVDMLLAFSQAFFRYLCQAIKGLKILSGTGPGGGGRAQCLKGRHYEEDRGKNECLEVDLKESQARIFELENDVAKLNAVVEEERKVGQNTTWEAELEMFEIKASGGDALVKEAAEVAPSPEDASVPSLRPYLCLKVLDLSFPLGVTSKADVTTTCEQALELGQ